MTFFSRSCRDEWWRLWWWITQIFVIFSQADYLKNLIFVIVIISKDLKDNPSEAWGVRELPWGHGEQLQVFSKHHRNDHGVRVDWVDLRGPGRHRAPWSDCIWPFPSRHWPSFKGVRFFLHPRNPTLSTVLCLLGSKSLLIVKSSSTYVECFTASKPAQCLSITKTKSTLTLTLALVLSLMTDMISLFFVQCSSRLVAN